MTIITALAFTMVVGTVLAGVGTLTMSHYSRSKVEGSYANAVAMADAGINFELNWISQNVTTPGNIHQFGNKFTGTTTTGSFTVYVQSWGSNCDGGTWSIPQDVCVVSTGKVNGVERKVRVRGTKKSLFDEYAIYAYNDSTFNGLGTTPNAVRVIGNMGTNGETTLNGGVGSTGIVGTLNLNGGTSGLSNSGDNKGNVVSNPDPVKFPTITQIANATFPNGGLTWLASHNDNSQIKMFRSTDTALASEPTIAGLTLSDVNTKLASAGFTTASRNLGNPPNTIPAATSSLDAPTATNGRFMVPADATYGISAYGIQGKQTYFFPPGDYYLSSWNWSKDDIGVVFLTHLGRVRIWIDSSGTSDDQVRKKNAFVFTSNDPTKFRLYYNKCATFDLQAHAKFNGSIYGIKEGCSGDTPEIEMNGGCMLYGSTIANYFSVSGGSKIVFPNNGGSDPDDYALWYGFADSWKEIPIRPDGRPVFVDGSSN